MDKEKLTAVLDKMVACIGQAAFDAKEANTMAEACLRLSQAYGLMTSAAEGFPERLQRIEKRLDEIAGLLDDAAALDWKGRPVLRRDAD